MASGDQEGASQPAILHILVVGFHHQKGSTVEFAYPPLERQQRGERESDHVTRSLTATLPAEWRHLPHLALPDGSHNYEKDSVYFTLPSCSVPSGWVFGVACCRQIPTRQLHQVEREVTRSTVQKSVCILSRYPAFKFLQSKLELVTHAYFNVKDFSDVTILHEAFSSINSQVSMASSLRALHLGLSQRELVLLLHHRLLQVVKALLLRKRVVVFGSPAEKVGSFVLSIAALFPLSLELHCDPDQLADKHGLPLMVFESPFSLQPYVCLQQMESLIDPLSSPRLAGVVNPLFEKQQKRVCDVFVDADQGSVSFQDSQTGSQLHLTSADLRFCSLLSQTVNEHSGTDEPTTFPGSSEWVKAQFKVYLLSLLATGENGDSISMDEFGQHFVSVWQKGDIFEAWRRRERGGIMRVDPRHPCEGDLSLGDVRRRLVARMSDYGLNVPSSEVVVHETQRIVSEAAGRVSGAVGGVWAAASASVHSWWTGGGKENEEERKDENR